MIKELFDCVIIGGGPAGSFAAKLLSDRSFSTLIIEKRSDYTEKVCGGFVPYKAIQILSRNGFDRIHLSSACGNKILVTDTNQSGRKERIAYPEGKYGIGVFRQVFDRYLSDMAIQSGTRILFSQPVTLDMIRYCTEEDIFLITLSDLSVKAKHLIIATGAMGLLPRKLTGDQSRLLKKRTFGVSEIIRCTSSLPRDQLLFHCPSPYSRDYFWMIPLERDSWNLGYWMERPDSSIKKSFYQYRERFFEPFCKIGEKSVLYPLRGAFLGNVDLSPFYPEKAYVIGDAGGNNAQTTGEGIRFAFESALETVTSIINVESKKIGFCIATK